MAIKENDGSIIQSIHRRYCCHHAIDTTTSKSSRSQKRSLFRLGTIAILISLAIHGIASFIVSNSATIKFDHPLFPTEFPYGEEDDIRVGKSCVYKHSHSSGKTLGNLFRYSFTNPWLCRECTSSTDNHGHDDDVTCKPLKRRGRCHPFPRMNPDANTPRIQTEYSPFVRSKSATMVYTHDGHTEYAARNVPLCTAALDPCFDLTRCKSSGSGGDSNDGPLKVYSYGGDIEAYLNYTTQQHPNLIQRVDNASEACLLVVGLHSFHSPEDLLHNDHWNGGRNHYIFESAKLFDSHWDRPFNDHLQFGMASISPHSMDDAYNREGYDTPLGLYPNWKRPEYSKEWDDMSRPRRYLLSFKGNIYPWEQRSWQHRWLAAEYWLGEEEDVYVDTSCMSSPFFRKEYLNKDTGDYGRLLLNSTFFFCPGGGGINSFRFPEVLSAGAIPVVTSDFLPPFHPEIDWTGCIVQVSEARVVDIPRIVREISVEEVRERRKRCARLFEAVFGNPPDVREHFSLAMRVWNVRVQNALKRKGEFESLIPATDQDDGQNVKKSYLMLP